MDRKFTVSFGRTVNTGDYSSMRLEISREYNVDNLFPDYLSVAEQDKRMKDAVLEVQKLVEAEVERILGEKK